MDVFHKVLTRIYELTGGRETQEVDLIELLKAEGFYPSRDSIKGHLSTEGWITDSARPDHIRITHWGMAEAKKTLADPTASGQGIDRHTTRLLSATRDFSIEIGEFVAKPTAVTIKPVEERISEISNLLSKIKSQL
jgi:hypothetical protein